MRKLISLVGIAALFVAASVVMAASPAPSSAPAGGSGAKSSTTTVSPSTTSSSGAAPAAAPKAATSSTSSTSGATGTWSAAVQPLTLQGTATISRDGSGTGRLSMAMQGLDPTQPWTVTIVPGQLGAFGNRSTLFQWHDSDIDRLGDGTLAVHLTDSEYDAISRARAKDGFVILVSDGSREAVATFPKA